MGIWLTLHCKVYPCFCLIFQRFGPTEGLKRCQHRAFTAALAAVKPAKSNPCRQHLPLAIAKADAPEAILQAMGAQRHRITIFKEGTGFAIGQR